MSKKPTFTFRLLGQHKDWYALRAPTWGTSQRKALDAQRFESNVTEWLLNEADGEWHLANGNAHGYPDVPMSFSTGTGLCLLLKRKADVARFANKFSVSDLANLDHLLENPERIQA